MGQKVKIFCEEGRTKQSFKDEVDINKIMKKVERGGMITHLNAREPFYGDVSGITGYQDALLVVNEAQELFSGLSAQIRKRFRNDPAEFIAFMDNPDNKKEAMELGIIPMEKDPNEIHWSDEDPNNPKNKKVVEEAIAKNAK